MALGKTTLTHSAWVTPLSAMRASTAASFSISSGKSRWQWESTNIAGLRGKERLLTFGRKPQIKGQRVWVGRDEPRWPARICSIRLRNTWPASSPANWTPMPWVLFPWAPGGVTQAMLPVHDLQQHENLVTQLVIAAGRQKDSAILEKGHVGRVERRLGADVERQDTWPCLYGALNGIVHLRIAGAVAWRHRAYRKSMSSRKSRALSGCCETRRDWVISL